MTTEVQEFVSVQPNDPAREKVKFKEKLGLSLAVIGNIPVMSLIGGFLLIFYTDVVGLNPAACATLFLVARIMDGISDPIMGFLLDRMPRTKMGKFRYLLIIGSIMCGLNLVLVFFGPAWATAGKLAIAYLTYLLLGFTFDIMDIAVNSMIPVMTYGLKERNQLGAIHGFSMMIGNVLIGVVAPLILAAGNSSLQAYYLLIFPFVALIILFSVIGAMGIKERVTPIKENARYKLKDYITIIKQRPVISYLALNLCFVIGALISSTLAVFYFTYVIGDLALMATISFVTIIGLLPGTFLSGTLLSKLGIKKSIIFASLIGAAGSLIRLIDPYSIVLIIIATLLFGFLSGIFIPLGKVIFSNNIDYVENKLGYRTEAAQASVGSFISKVGLGIGGAIPGYLLAVFGYVANSQQQPASAINGIILLTALGPAVFFVIGLIIFGIWYNLDKSKVDEIQTALSEKRAAIASDK